MDVEQEIRFTVQDGASVAIAVAGEGDHPPLLMPGYWVSHVEGDWRGERFRTFIEHLARNRTVIRYDRLGTGLSDRERRRDQMSLDVEAETIDAVLDEVGVELCDLLGFSCGGPIGVTFAHRSPERVRRMVLYGSYAVGTMLGSTPVRESMLALVRAHWGLGSRVMAEMFVPNGSPADRREFVEWQQRCASAEMAAELLELVYDADVRPLLGELDLCVQVVHRREDRAVPLRHGRTLAASIPGARFMTLDGDDHLPWHGDTTALAHAIDWFLRDDAAPAVANGDGVLSDREREILRMVARGLSDRQIAEALVLSPHTVHRHVANIRTKLRQPTRTAAATEAARLQLI